MEIIKKMLTVVAARFKIVLVVFLWGLQNGAERLGFKTSFFLPV